MTGWKVAAKQTANRIKRNDTDWAYKMRPLPDEEAIPDPNGRLPSDEAAERIDGPSGEDDRRELERHRMITHGLEIAYMVDPRLPGMLIMLQRGMNQSEVGKRFGLDQRTVSALVKRLREKTAYLLAI